MRQGFLILLAIWMLFAGVCFAEKVTIYRDEWGVPHIYAQTEEGVAYGLGWAQAEDRLEQLLKNYRLAAGTMAEVFGEQWI
ncbi:Penicillin G acylase [bacterium HR16]|nr:Penicillin G acylase [bacterium HR16]